MSSYPAAFALALLAGCGPLVVLEADELAGVVGRLLGQEARPRSAPRDPWHLRTVHGGTLTLEPLAVSITPITSLAAPSSGIVYSGDSYEVACTVTGTVVLYPVVHDGTAWAGPYEGYACTLADTVATRGSCIFPARSGTDLTWNAFKTGSGTVSGCTAAGRAGPVPASPRSSGSSGGTVTSIDCQTGLTCTPDPITSAGTIALADTAVTPGSYGSATQVGTFTVDQQGRITAASSVAIAGGIALITVGAEGVIAAGSTRYLNAPGVAWSAGENYAAISTRAQTIRSLYCYLGTAPGGSGAGTMTLTVRKNGVDQLTACTITDPATDCNNTADTFTAVAGDRLSMKGATNGSANNGANLTCTFEVAS